MISSCRQRLSYGERAGLTAKSIRHILIVRKLPTYSSTWFCPGLTIDRAGSTESVKDTSREILHSEHSRLFSPDNCNAGIVNYCKIFTVK